MARHSDSPAGEALDEIASFGERIAGWVGANPILVLAGATAILLIAAAYGGYRTFAGRSEDRASAAVAAAERQYLEAMGTTPDTGEVAEPANPETAARARREAVDRLLALAKEHAGTSAARLAILEAGDLQEQLGDHDLAVETWRGALEGTAAGSEVRGLLLLRIAQAHEAAGRWAEAGESYAQAGELEAYPMRAWALADAARCFSEAGDAARAQTLAVRVGTEPGAAALPPQLMSQIAELRGAAPSPAAPESPQAEPAPQP